jgi:hypothetical protein
MNKIILVFFKRAHTHTRTPIKIYFVHVYLANAYQNSNEFHIFQQACHHYFKFKINEDEAENQILIMQQGMCT